MPKSKVSQSELDEQSYLPYEYLDSAEITVSAKASVSQSGFEYERVHVRSVGILPQDNIPNDRHIMNNLAAKLAATIWADVMKAEGYHLTGADYYKLVDDIRWTLYEMYGKYERQVKKPEPESGKKIKRKNYV